MISYAITTAILLFLIVFAPRFTMFVTVIALALFGGADIEASHNAILGTVLALIMIWIFPRATALTVLAALSVIIMPLWLFVIIGLLLVSIDVLMLME